MYNNQKNWIDIVGKLIEAGKEITLDALKHSFWIALATIAVEFLLILHFGYVPLYGSHIIV